MSLKEKVQVVINQKGKFTCPNGAGYTKEAPKAQTPKPQTPKLQTPKPQIPTHTTPTARKRKEDKFSLVVTNLRQRPNARPATLKALTSTLVSLFPEGLPEAELKSLLQQLQSTGKVIVTENKVTYAL